MSGAEFERISVLIVDDSELIRSIITSVFKTVGVRQIFTAEDGVQAIEFMQQVSSAPTKAGTSQVDLVVADLLMPRLDGHMLMRWLRVQPTSPDRFISILVISGAADLARVELARDLGANEIMGKPFSARTLADKLVHMINYPRQFVLALGYFGPDRRRASKPVERDRRRTPEDAIQVINAGDGTKNFKAGAKIVYFRLRNRLKDKVAFGEDVPPFDPALIKKAEERIQSFAGDYSDWVGASVRTLQESVAALLESRGDQGELLAKVNLLGLELGSQGGIFNYPLVTKLGKSLYSITLNPDNLTIEMGFLRLLKAHVDAITAVIKDRISGDGGPIGREILASMEKAKVKFGSQRLTAVAE